MQLVYASRTGNVEKLISRLGISALKIESGEEKVSGDYVLVTYTDGAGIFHLQSRNSLKKTRVD